MSEPRTHDAEFSEMWRSVSKLSHNKLQQDSRTGKQTFDTTSHGCNDLQSPKRITCSRYLGLNNGDSPGDGEVSQDIIWDPTSPTQVNTGKGLRNTRVVEISDIVNRIAPKDAKPVGVESPLLQWIGDSAVPCTPENRQPRVRKKSMRQSNVEDLRKLARQFDKNMQRDNETSEQLNAINNNLTECGKTPEAKPTETAHPSNAKELKCSSTSDQVEAELHALFDCSTQRVSGRLSQGSLASTCSQEIKGQPRSAEPRQSELKLADNKSGPAAHAAEDKGSWGISANKFDDFDDDWENDDLLNDSFVLAMTQNSDQQLDPVPKTTLRSNTTPYPSASKPSINVRSACQAPSLHLQPSCSGLQELCPKPKTTNRSTFKLEPNPHFQAKTAAANELSKPSLIAIQPSKSQMPDQKRATTKPASSTTKSAPQPGKITPDQVVKGAGVAADTSDRNKKSCFDSDCLWDDGDDDKLLYQVCDNVERISNSQPEQPSPTYRQENKGQRKTTAPLPIETARPINTDTSANRQSPCAFVRSNSLPGTSCETVNYQGWNVPMKGASSKSRMSQSLPGSRVGLGAFSQFKDSCGTFQAANANLETQPRTVTARQPQNSHHASFKRSLSDSVAMSNKVFVTSQMTGKCSAAEIERKKQEALARRRLRKQNTPKP
ncbi:ewing's tumor-associated antigen 1 homolog [Centroberyx affinis]|uniref:ewing's tumor-associated antigen 1 homolog n=1 Tax=Centroberyx affinis TaxID=166261 RepID=UPI003A5BDDEE